MPDYVLADNMAAKEADRKKTFEFRMSKKVAELTQVVHMLFTRNHEKEVELEAVKEAYEFEIGLVIKDAKERIGVLEKQMQIIEKTKDGNGNEAKASLEREMARREEEWQKRLLSMERQINDEKKECQNARDLLIQAQRDIEQLRECQSEELSRKSRELDNKSRELERCRQTIIALEKRLKDSDSNVNCSLQELRRENDKLRVDLTTVHGNLADNERMREQVGARNKQLEAEIRSLKKDMVKRAERSGRSSAQSRPEVRDPVPMPEYMEELERLRREVQRYRNELCNREENFNRMFTQQHPVVVDKRAGKMAFGMPAEAAAHLRYAMGNREGSFLTASYPTAHPMTAGKGLTGSASQASNSRPNSGVEERDLMGLHGSPRNTQTITARLPQLGLEARRQAAGSGARLAKPRPLPREMLSAKAGGHG